MAAGAAIGRGGPSGSRGRARRPKPTKLALCPTLLAAVQAGLERRWSPQQISARLRLDHPDDGQMRISHETIYQSLFVQSRGELRRQLTREPAHAGATAAARGRPSIAGGSPSMVPIAERPPEVDDRARPGPLGRRSAHRRAGKSAIATLVERQTRYVLLARLGTTHHRAVTDALSSASRTLPTHLLGR